MTGVSGVKIRENIIGILRGRYATSVLSTIGTLGIADQLIDKPCRIEDFKEIKNTDKLQAILNYLVAINLLEENTGVYQPTDLGQHVLKRVGSASIIESYYEYMSHLPDILMQDPTERPYTVDRPLNIFGSGDIHKRKFFPKAIEQINNLSIDSLVDLGCGDGTFLEIAGKDIPSIHNFSGIDLSEQSTTTTKTLLDHSFADKTSLTITCDACDVEKWAKDLPSFDKEEVISAWFVLHEFSAGSADKIIRFFEDIHTHRPRSHVLIGELVHAAPEELALNSSMTIMPEFLFFHALSGQAPLSWPVWNKIKENIPYDIVYQHAFDPIQIKGDDVPSNFIWLLKPKS